MSNKRFFVEKKENCRYDAERLLKQFREELGIMSLEKLRLINCYDIFNADLSKDELDKLKYMILSEKATDDIYENLDLNGQIYFAVEYLPGQFDQRRDSAIQCVDIVLGNANIDILTSKIIILKGKVSKEEIKKIKQFYINPIETREKNLNILKKENSVTHSNIPIYTNFTKLSHEELENFRKKLSLSMTFADLLHIQNYYKQENRNPNETEIKVFDTYWSDHCRHTTFETKIKNVEFPDSKYGKTLENEYNKFLAMLNVYYDSKNKRVSNFSLMDMATINAKFLKLKGKLNDLEESEENNACSMYIDVDVKDLNGNESIEKWLLMFKNETHNHPTEIEPFGGASTCLGGAIRDPLSGRAYVYQAIRVTGSANPLESLEKTLKGKLSQKKITTGAASGYSSYGNQIGIATSLVSEIYHKGYKAKRMEVGAVVAATPIENVVRKSPMPGDIIILLGGKTGRDGCGGATGSSKVHDDTSLYVCGSEVQKGNAPEERKIQRLFRNKEATQLIKKCNDFGAGGVSVAIGELSDGIDVNLDLIPVKYEGLNGTELAISESQERMAVVISREDEEEFLKYSYEENLLATKVGEITDNKRLVLRWKNKKLVDISRDFLDTNGASQEIEIKVLDLEKTNILERKLKGNGVKEKWINNIKSLEVASQKGLQEMFDSSIGAGTVLMPFGGKYQSSPIDVSIVKIPVLNKMTNTASSITWGYNPYIMEKSPYHGGIYSVIDSLTKLVAAGVDYKNARLSFQEYFEKLGKDPIKWSKVFLALLGSIKIQNDFEIAAIGGKDSMSGTFNDISVPPTLISFAVNTVDARNVISTEFKKSNSKIYLVENEIDEDLNFDINKLKDNFDKVLKGINEKYILSASSIKYGGISEALTKMSFGNKIGIKLLDEKIDLFSYKPGSIIIESDEELDFKLIGQTIDEYVIKIDNDEISLNFLENGNLEKLHPVFPYEYREKIKIYKPKLISSLKEYKSSIRYAKPRVTIIAFPGTNCEYDMQNIFNKNGAISKIVVFRNIDSISIKNSIEEICKEIRKSQILVLPGGFSAGDEPDGSGKFIVAILQNPYIKEEIEKFLERDGLILGICNGFQALVKSGLLPFAKIGDIDENSATLTYNKIGRHISQIVKTKIVTNASPWLSSFKIGEIFDIPVSHGEGRFFANEKLLNKLIENNQIATVYTNLDGEATNEFKYNPNGSTFAIEGLISPDGKIFGKMGHSERYSENIYKNIEGKKYQNIFLNGINYFK